MIKSASDGGETHERKGRDEEMIDTSAVVLLTGATGTIGSEVLDLVAGRARIRALARSDFAASAIARLHPTVEIVRGDLADGASLGEALAGVDRMLLLAPSIAQQQLLEENALQAALAAGVRRIVYISNREVDWGIELARPHVAIEARLAQSGIEHTSLRPDYLLDNLLHELESLAAGRVIAPSGRGRCAFVDARDVASVAARAVLDDDPLPGPLELTGPESLTFTELAARLGESLGWRIEHLDPEPREWSSAAIAAGMPQWLAEALREYFERLRDEAPQPTGDVGRITGADPRRIEDFARDRLAPALQRGAVARQPTAREGLGPDSTADAGDGQREQITCLK